MDLTGTLSTFKKTKHTTAYFDQLSEAAKTFEGTSTTINSELSNISSPARNHIQSFVPKLFSTNGVYSQHTLLLIKSLHSRVALRNPNIANEQSYYKEIMRYRSL